jgi:EAL domain-containing protein (putative c-di-GMP-specific phosphodiesterase class I)
MKEKDLVYLQDLTTGLPTLLGIISNLKVRLEKEKELVVFFVTIKDPALYEQEFGFDVFDSWIKNIADVLKKFILKEFATFENPTLFITEPFTSSFVIVTSKSVDEESVKEKLKRILSKEISLPIAIISKRVSYDPVRRSERIIFSVISTLKYEILKEESKIEHKLKTLFRNILKRADIKILYQPIYSLHRLHQKGEIFGYEALARGPKNTIFEMPSALFTIAEDMGELENLEKICRWKALLTFGKLKNKEKVIFLNTTSKILQKSSSQFVDELIGNIEDLGIKKERVVIELTERYAITNFENLKKNIGKLKSNGIKISIDDVGVGYATLQTLAELTPDFLKYDMLLVRNIHKDLVKQNLLELVMNFSEKIKAPLIAEGVEKEEELEVLRKLGVKYAQGFLLSKPLEIEI